MEKIEKNKNKLTTECGHTFHTSCLMTNIAKNGFGCPYCRTLMAEQVAEQELDDLPTLVSSDWEGYQWDFEQELARTLGQPNRLIRAIRAREVIEIEDDLPDIQPEEAEATEIVHDFTAGPDPTPQIADDLPAMRPVPTPQEIVVKLQERGITMCHFVQAYLKDFASYGDDEIFFMHVDDEIYEHVNEIIQET
jgi:hypothetical protein